MLRLILLKSEKLEFKRYKIEVIFKWNMAYEIINKAVSFQYQGMELITGLNNYIHVREKQKDGFW